MQSTPTARRGPSAGTARLSASGLACRLPTSLMSVKGRQRILRAQDDMPYLELDKLTKRFGDQLAVEGLSLVVDKGEFVTLLGPSGCGKTTTLQMIAGFADVTSGSIRVGGGGLVAVKPARRGLGIVFQSYALFPHMTAGANVAFGLEMQGVGRAERDARVRDALALVGLGGLGERYPRRMSGGQHARVALAPARGIRSAL